jgi:hypothetical protein
LRQKKTTGEIIAQSFISNFYVLGYCPRELRKYLWRKRPAALLVDLKSRASSD